jgi:hypothetical protein
VTSKSTKQVNNDRDLFYKNKRIIEQKRGCTTLWALYNFTKRFSVIQQHSQQNQNIRNSPTSNRSWYSSLWKFDTKVVNAFSLIKISNKKLSNFGKTWASRRNICEAFGLPFGDKACVVVMYVCIFITSDPPRLLTVAMLILKYFSAILRMLCSVNSTSDYTLWTLDFITRPKVNLLLELLCFKNTAKNRRWVVLNI